MHFAWLGDLRLRVNFDVVDNLAVELLVVPLLIARLVKRVFLMGRQIVQKPSRLVTMFQNTRTCRTCCLYH